MTICNMSTFFSMILMAMHLQAIRGKKGKNILGYCPYCDPNYVDVPNLQSAMQGYDLPMGDPNRNYYWALYTK